jgi:rare lipoprotein A
VPRCSDIESAHAVLPHANNINPRRPRGCLKEWESALRLKCICLLAAAIQLAPISMVGAFAETQSGIASIYSTESGSRTASGRRLDPGALTAAHRSLPFGSKVRVTNRHNGRSIVVTVIDRGPFVRGRIIDLTPAAGRALGFSGLAPVTVDRE